MFNTITTSEENRAVVTELTNRFALGAENVIARIAFCYSLSLGDKLRLSDLQDARGKTYTAKILFGNHVEFYVAMLCQHYQLHKSDKDIPRYIKLHIDHGLQEMKAYANSDGMDFLIKAIEDGLVEQPSLF